MPKQQQRLPAQASPAISGSALSQERALARFGWLGDPDDLLQQLGISRAKLRAIQHDDEVAAALETRFAACINTPWRVEHEDDAVRAFVADAIRPVFYEMVRAAWQAVPYGFSVFELVYLHPQDARNKTPGRIGIAQVIECPFEWFLIKPDQSLWWRDDQTPVDELRFVKTVNNGSLRKPHGDALLAKAYWPWFFRTHGWRMWAKFLEQAAIPLMYGKTYRPAEKPGAD